MEIDESNAEDLWVVPAVDLKNAFSRGGIKSSDIPMGPAGFAVGARYWESAENIVSTCCDGIWKKSDLESTVWCGGKYLDLVVGVLPSNSKNKFLAKSNSSSIKLHVYHEIINAIESLTRQVVKFASEREVEGGSLLSQSSIKALVAETLVCLSNSKRALSALTGKNEEYQLEPLRQLWLELDDTIRKIGLLFGGRSVLEGGVISFRAHAMLIYKAYLHE